MCFVRNVQASRTKHIGLESPMGPCLRHVMFAHIMRVEVVRIEWRWTKWAGVSGCGKPAVARGVQRE